ncbi:MAG: Pathosis-related thaumatin superfamily protein [Deltaproteobacteria bacterium]|nr:Pathosis-related thaumatin superfamily protein [Deltaproteobacteria bacterium]
MVLIHDSVDQCVSKNIEGGCMHSKSVSLCIILFLSLMLVFSVSVYAQRTSTPTQIAPKVSAGGTRTVTIINNCDQDIWWGVITSQKAQKDQCATGYYKHPGNGGDKINKNGGRATITVPLEPICNANKGWSGNFYARTGCKQFGNAWTCETGNCGGQEHCSKEGVGGAPPHGQAEFFFDMNGNDFYDISGVDGYNMTIAIKPTSIVGNTKGNEFWCTESACKFNFVQEKNTDDETYCPKHMKVRVGNKLVGCTSDCQAYDAGHGDKMANSWYCCSGSWSGPAGRKDCGNCCHLKKASGLTGTPFPVPSSKWFKDKCPKAYAWPQDDASSTFSCQSKAYEVTFCAK